MLDAEQRTLIDRYVCAYNASDVEGMLSTLAPNVRFENHSDQQPAVVTDGREAFRELAEQSLALFSEREQRVRSISFRACGAVAEIMYCGVLVAPESSGELVRNVVRLEGSTEFSFENGLISKIVDRG